MNYNKPVMIIRKDDYGKNYYEVYSKKINRIVQLFSHIRYANFLTLEMNPSVKKFCERPLELEVQLEGKIQKTVIDFWVKYKDESEEMQVIEHLDEHHQEDGSSTYDQEMLRRKKKWCEENNIKFTVRNANDINEGRFYIRNLEYLSAKSRRYIPLDDNYYRKLVINTLKHYKQISIANLIKLECLPCEHELDYLSYLYYEGVITMDISNRPIDGSMEVSIWQPRH